MDYSLFFRGPAKTPLEPATCPAEVPPESATCHKPPGKSPADPGESSCSKIAFSKYFQQFNICLNKQNTANKK